MARLIEFEGRQFELPDDATDDEVASALSAAVPGEQTTTLAQPSFPQRAGRAIGLGTQGVGAGVADIAGMPVDLAAGGVNLLTRGINWATGTDIPAVTKPFLGSESIRDTASNLAGFLGVPTVSEDQMQPRERLSYNINRFGTQGLGLGSAFAARAPALAARVAAGEKPAEGLMSSLGNTMTRQYVEAPTRTVAGDVAAGVGSGAGVNFARENVAEDSPWRPLAETGGALAGGTGGAAALSIGEGLGNLFRSIVANRRPDKSIPMNPQTNAPFTMAETEAGARRFQESALNPAEASFNIRQGAKQLDQAGFAPSEQPTSGLLSRDPGLVSAEYNKARTQNGAPFIERDQNVKQAAAERVESLKDPKADQGLVQQEAQNRPRELAAARDAEALPLLREAEASGVQVDAAPVLAVIDDKLATAKRPPVRAALTEARKMLNKPGTEEIDTSVSGLYETRKAINDIIEGRGENATGRFAKKELLEVRQALDDAIVKAEPRFGQYMEKYRAGSEQLDVFSDSATLAKVLQDDPRNVAVALMRDTYGADKKLGEINQAIGNNPEAKRGWKAAVAEVLADRVQSTRKTGETYEVQYARLAKEFKDNEQMLVKSGFTPEDMNTLRQAHTLLGYFKEAEKRASIGSNTADKVGDVPGWIQLAARHLYGDLRGGGIVRRFKLFMSLLPNDQQAIQELTRQAWFDPEVAAYLLDRPVKATGGAPYNVNLKRLIAGGAGGRSSAEED